MMFASLVFEREPMTWSNLPDALFVWMQNAGAVAAFGILLVLISRVFQRDAGERNVWNLPGGLQVASAYLAYIFAIPAICYTIVIVCFLGDWIGIRGARMFLPRGRPDEPFTIGDWLLSIGGVISLTVAVTPILIDLVTRISWGRIWAIARLSWKEAIRGRVIWVFGLIALVFLFAGWFMPYKAENQLKNYVSIVYFAMTALFLIAASILGSFGIPNDVKNNSIHTIVTKPVEKFEIVLGRFLGYGALLTIGLFIVSCVSLLYVVRGVNEEAAKESYKARVPIYGRMHFTGTKQAQKAESVGREWGYRSYITGPRKGDVLRQFAIWDIEKVPADLAEGPEPVLFEFAFDIFRLSKGTEGEGIFCTFTFTDSIIPAQQVEPQAHAATKEREKRIAQERPELTAFAAAVQSAQKKDAAEQAQIVQKAVDALKERDSYFKPAMQKLVNEFVRESNPAEREEALGRLLTGGRDQAVYVIDRAIALEFGVYPARNLEVTDQHTQGSEVPPGILKALEESRAKKGGGEPGTPAVQVFLSVDPAREQQMLGVAQQDFYIVAYEMPFALNFLKGVFGMWCTHMIVLAVAIALSTYLSAVISFLGTMFLYMTGLFVDYLREIAEKKVDGGGPLESMIRITGHMPIAAKLDDSPTKTLVDAVDAVWAWWIGFLMRLIPDINRHDLHQYVANGFDINLLDVMFLDNFLPMAGYLVPWAILAYYLMKYREIANPS